MPKPNKAELLIYKALKKAITEKLLYLYLDADKINRPNSPIYNPWENLLPLLIPTIIGLFLIIYQGIFYGLAVIIGMLLIYLLGIKQLIGKLLLHRAKKYILQNFEQCQRLWNFGGIVLAAASNKKVACISPENDWKEYIVQNFAYLMTEPQETKKATKDEKSAA
ncbi:MAG: hypothetical protein IJ660_07500 [Alphaproteobacteria bacterium]|nr:hypothetical protein [Alphaproteobacteria bacterium]